jgi:hypothetical protein
MKVNMPDSITAKLDIGSFVANKDGTVTISSIELHKIVSSCMAPPIGPVGPGPSPPGGPPPMGPGTIGNPTPAQPQPIITIIFS